jgi:RNA polymerase sigma-70 factor (ECF subfamily)
MSSQIPDRELVERCLDGETEPFHALVERYQGPVYRVVRRFLRNHDDAMEIVQEAFARAWEKLASFDLARPFSTWLFSVAANLARDLLRKRGRRGEVLDTERIYAAPGRESPEGDVEAREQAERLQAAVDELDEDKRLAVVLRYFEGMALAEIAEITGTPVSTLKVRLFRARKDLMERLSE